MSLEGGPAAIGSAVSALASAGESLASAAVAPAVAATAELSVAIPSFSISDQSPSPAINPGSLENTVPHGPLWSDGVSLDTSIQREDFTSLPTMWTRPDSSGEVANEPIPLEYTPTSDLMKTAPSLQSEIGEAALPTAPIQSIEVSSHEADAIRLSSIRTELEALKAGEPMNTSLLSEVESIKHGELDPFTLEAVTRPTVDSVVDAILDGSEERAPVFVLSQPSPEVQEMPETVEIAAEDMSDAGDIEADPEASPGVVGVASPTEAEAIPELQSVGVVLDIEPQITTASDNADSSLHMLPLVENLETEEEVAIQPEEESATADISQEQLIEEESVEDEGKQTASVNDQALVIDEEANAARQKSAMGAVQEAFEDKEAEGDGHTTWGIDVIEGDFIAEKMSAPEHDDNMRSGLIKDNSRSKDGSLEGFIDDLKAAEFTEENAVLIVHAAVINNNAVTDLVTSGQKASEDEVAKVLKGQPIPSTPESPLPTYGEVF